MYRLPTGINDLIEQISRLPGLGSKTAARLVFYLLEDNPSLATELSQALLSFNEGFKRCVQCGAVIEPTATLCGVCDDPNRDKSTICVVEDEQDLLAIEEGGGYAGLYHVLGGEVSPAAGTGPQDLNISSLVGRITKEGGASEVIIATNPTITGQATAEYIANLLRDKSVKVTRIAHGLPFGGDLEYADKETLREAIRGRHDI